MLRGSRAAAEGGSMIGWLDCSSGVAGDGARRTGRCRVPVDVMQAAVDEVAPSRSAPIEETRRRGQAIRVHVDGAESGTTRTWADIRALLTPIGSSTPSERATAT
jgi:hypothetical protein